MLIVGDASFYKLISNVTNFQLIPTFTMFHRTCNAVFNETVKKLHFSSQSPRESDLAFFLVAYGLGLYCISFPGKSSQLEIFLSSKDSQAVLEILL